MDLSVVFLGQYVFTYIFHRVVELLISTSTKQEVLNSAIDTLNISSSILRKLNIYYEEVAKMIEIVYSKYACYTMYVM